VELQTNRNPEKFLALLICISAPVAIITTICWFGVFTFVNGYIVKGLGHSNETWTAVSLWFTGSMVFWPVISTEISAKIGRRTTMTLSMFVAAFFYFGIAVTQNLILIRALLALVGLVITVGNVSWLSMVAQISPQKPARALAVYQLVGVVVGVVTLVSGGYLISHLAYKTAFILFGAICGICGIVFHVLSGSMEGKENAAVLSFRNFTRQDLKSMVTGPFLAVMLLGIGLGPFNYHTINQLFPNLARDAFHLSDKGIGTVVALGRLPAILMLLFLAHRVDRINVFRIYGLAICLTGIWLASLGQMKGLDMAIVCYLGFYVCHGGTWSTETAAVNLIAQPRLRDTVFAVMSILATASVFITGLVHNRMLAAGFTLPQIFLVCGMIGMMGGFLLFLYSFSKSAKQCRTK
jgi:MFS family permease